MVNKDYRNVLGGADVNAVVLVGCLFQFRPTSDGSTLAQLTYYTGARRVPWSHNAVVTTVRIDCDSMGVIIVIEFI